MSAAAIRETQVGWAARFSPVHSSVIEVHAEHFRGAVRIGRAGRAAGCDVSRIVQYMCMHLLVGGGQGIALALETIA
jgi:hypothetical protein